MVAYQCLQVWARKVGASIVRSTTPPGLPRRTSPHDTSLPINRQRQLALVCTSCPTLFCSCSYEKLNAAGAPVKFETYPFMGARGKGRARAGHVARRAGGPAGCRRALAATCACIVRMHSTWCLDAPPLLRSLTRRPLSPSSPLPRPRRPPAGGAIARCSGAAARFAPTQRSPSDTPSLPPSLPRPRSLPGGAARNEGFPAGVPGIQENRKDVKAVKHSACHRRAPRRRGPRPAPSCAPLQHFDEHGPCRPL